MSEAPVKYEYAITPEMAEALVVEGDLSKLTPAQRMEYYVRVCKSLGLNPLTRPFQYIRLQNKLTLYATRDATDQIRNLRNISVRPVRREFVLDNSIYVVEVEAELPNGRRDFATAAVPVKGLTGDALANALMKAETKAKRRVTLSIAGLGMLDETEVETIPDAMPANGDAVYPDAEQVQQHPEDAPALATEKQVRKIQVLAKQLGMSKEEYRETLHHAYGVDSSRKLTVQQASEFIEYLQSLVEEPESESHPQEHEDATPPTTTQDTSTQDAPTQDNPPSAPNSVNVTDALKYECARLGFNGAQIIAIRSAIRSANVDAEVALGVLRQVRTKTDAIEGLRMIGVPNPFKSSAAAGA